MRGLQCHKTEHRREKLWVLVYLPAFMLSADVGSCCKSGRLMLMPDRVRASITDCAGVLLNDVLDTWVMDVHLGPILSDKSMCKQDCHVMTQSLQTTEWL